MIVTVGDVEVAGLLRGVAVGRGHALPQRPERGLVGRGQPGRGVVVRVAVRPEHQLRVGVEVDVRLDLLDPADDPAGDEVAHPLGLRRGERGRAAVGLRRGAAGRAAAAAPLVAPVAVEVGADGAGAGVGLPVLPPGPVRPGGDVVLGAVRVHRDHDPDLAGVDQGADRRVGGVLRGQLGDDVEAHLRGQVLPGVLLAGEEDLGLVLVGGHVVADLHRGQLPALVRGADALPADQRRVRRDGRVDHGVLLGVVVVAAVGRREVVGHRAARGAGAGRRQRGDGVAELAQRGDLGRGGGDEQRPVLGTVDGGAGARHLAALDDVAHAVDLVGRRRRRGGRGGRGRGGTGLRRQRHDRERRDGADGQCGAQPG